MMRNEKSLVFIKRRVKLVSKKREKELKKKKRKEMNIVKINYTSYQLRGVTMHANCMRKNLSFF